MSSSSGKQTVLHAEHVAQGARMVDFGGWKLPLHYGSQLQEHHCVRRHAGVFDVSHMTVIDVQGPGARAYLRHLLANDVDVLTDDPHALYSCVLNEAGGILDDVIVYRLAGNRFRVVANAATREKDLAWMRLQVGAHQVAVIARDDLAMLAVQGPRARALAASLFDADAGASLTDLARFGVAELTDLCVARTGYTGEDGLEITLPTSAAPAFWRRLIAAGVAPVGLGARDTLRLEAGLNLYGADMDEQVSPLECGLSWTVNLRGDRDFIGRAALLEQRARGVARGRVGLIVDGRGIPRAHQKVIADGAEGEVTSGTFSPSLNVPIAFARVSTDIGENCEVENRGRRFAARVVKPPFVRGGQPCY